MKSTFTTIKDLELSINSIVSSNYGNQLVKFYAHRFNIPEEVCSQYIKQKLASNYSVKFSRYIYLLNLSYILFSILKYLFFLFVVLLFSKKIKLIRNNFSLVIDDIQNQNEFDRWSDLEDNFTETETLYITRFLPKETEQRKNVISRRTLHGYDRGSILNEGIKNLIGDILYLISISFKININLIHLHSHFINDYFYYHSLFKICNAKYMIQDRNLGRTNALKNYLFKSSGGIASSCIQKNIAQHNGNALFYDIDIFFAYGDKTVEDIMNLGARIDRLCPVGSFALNNSSLESDSIKKIDKIDILYIGINAVTSDKTDWSGYYESINWLAKLANANKQLNIAIKHHPSWTSDKKELDIIKDSGITYLDKSIDSYQAASQSTYIVTYGSSMGYELTGYNFNVMFIDPSFNNPFINNFIHNDKNIIYKYEELESLINNPEYFNEKKNKIRNIDYCYQNQEVAKTIYEILVNYRS